jgi:protein O-GlcNAc transferase
MKKLTEETKGLLLSLIKNQNFDKIEKLLLSLDEVEKNKPFLLNLLGVSKLTKKALNKEEAIKEVTEAQDLFRNAYHKDNLFLDALYNLAETSLKTSNYENVLVLLEGHLKKVSYDFKTVFLLAKINFRLGNIEQSINYYEKIIKNNNATPAVWKNLIFISNYSSQFSQKKYLNLCKRYTSTIKKIEKKNFKNFTYKKNIKKKKIGFFSVDFKEHAVMNFLTETIKMLNLNNFETIAFNLTEPNSNDSKTEQLKELFTDWHNIHGLDDIKIVNLIRDNRINILFDLVGYTSGSKMELFKYRSAPNQISWIGYTNSTGLDEMDYIVTDPNVIEVEENYSEKFLQLPDIWNCHSPIKQKIEIEDLPALKNGYITFGSFNNYAKISDETIEIWCDLLLKLKSKLILKTSDEKFKSWENILLSKFEKRGVNPKNIKFLKRTKSFDDHLKCYNKIDIALDTFPYNGATTSFESIWMGVPVLTIKGKNFKSRYGYSINKNLNMDRFIAIDKKDFINKGILNSSDLKKLNELRKKLRNMALKSPLFDTQRFNKSFLKVLNELIEKQ